MHASDSKDGPMQKRSTDEALHALYASPIVHVARKPTKLLAGGATVHDQ
jgi:hypothetical protein